MKKRYLQFRLMSSIILLLALALVLFSGCGKSKTRDLISPPAISDELQAELETWLDDYGRDPDDYVAALFASHDVVILGEQHRIKHDEEFIASLLAPLHESGVHVLATEFARRSDQYLLDSLLNKETWDETLARDILFRQFMPWGFVEYVDILHAAWQVTHARSAEDPPMRVLGVNHTVDYSHFKTQEDWENSEVWDLVMNGQTEADWANVVLDAVEQGEKVVVHCGIHHAFSGFQQPVVRDGEFVRYSTERMGNFLRDSLGTKAVTVYLHAPWNTSAGYNADFIHPADGRLDAFMLARENGPFTVGFDVADCPLAHLPITDAVYMHGYAGVEESPAVDDGMFTIADFCDGWIYTKPVSEYEPVTYIEGWINEGNLEQARATAMNPGWRTMSVDELNDGCKSYLQDFERFYSRLE